MFVNVLGLSRTSRLLGTGVFGDLNEAAVKGEKSGCGHDPDKSLSQFGRDHVSRKAYFRVAE